MGYDEKRLQTRVNRLHRCGLCLQLCDLDLLVESKCLHVFCRRCFHKYLQDCGHRSGLFQLTETYSNANVPIKCPITGKVLKASHLRKGLLDELTSFSIRSYKITCDYEPKGCRVIVPIGRLNQHLQHCSFRSENTIAQPPTSSSSTLAASASSLTSTMLPPLSSSSSSSGQRQFYVELNPLNVNQPFASRQISSTQTQTGNAVTNSLNSMVLAPENVQSSREPASRSAVQTESSAKSSISAELSQSRMESVNLERRAMNINNLLDLSEPANDNHTANSVINVARSEKSFESNLFDLEQINFGDLFESLQKMEQKLSDLCEKPLLKQQEQLIELEFKVPVRRRL